MLSSPITGHDLVDNSLPLVHLMPRSEPVDACLYLDLSHTSWLSLFVAPVTLWTCTQFEIEEKLFLLSDQFQTAPLLLKQAMPSCCWPKLCLIGQQESGILDNPFFAFWFKTTAHPHTVVCTGSVNADLGFGCGIYDFVVMLLHYSNRWMNPKPGSPAG